MSVHIEWATAEYVAKDARVFTAEEAAEYGIEGDEVSTFSHVLVLDTGSSSVAIEGTPDEIIAFAAKLHALGMDALNTQNTPAARECPQHGGPWGSDETCYTCTNEDGSSK